MRCRPTYGNNWILKYRAASVGLLVKLIAGAAAVNIPLKAVNGTVRLVVDQT